MKALFFTIALVLVASVAWGESLTCDPQAGVEKYRVSIPSEGITNEESVAQPDGSCLHDISGWPVGTYSGIIEAGADYILNGTPQGVWVWSDPAPFDLTKPGPISPNLQAVVP